MEDIDIWFEDIQAHTAMPATSPPPLSQTKISDIFKRTAPLERDSDDEDYRPPLKRLRKMSDSTPPIAPTRIKKAPKGPCEPTVFVNLSADIECEQSIYGRKEQVSLLQSRLQSGTPVILFSDVHCGKTSVVRNLAQTLKTTRPIYMLDMAQYDSEAHDEDLENLLEKEFEQEPKPIIYLKNIHYFINNQGVMACLGRVLTRHTDLIASCPPFSKIQVDGQRAAKDVFAEFGFVTQQIEDLDEQSVVAMIVQTLGHNPDIARDAVRFCKQYYSEQALSFTSRWLLSAALSYANLRSPCRVLTKEALATFVSHDREVPLETLLTTDWERATLIVEKLKNDIVGQEEAMDAIGSCVHNIIAGLVDARTPRAVMLFTGPTGVGKTRAAQKLTELLCGDKSKLFTLRMGEFTGDFSGSRLLGAEPGLLGYAQGSSLAQHIQLHPDAVILVDELEKAHTSVLPIMLNIFDQGEFQTAAGDVINCRNTIFIMTSNIGAQKLYEAGDISAHVAKQLVKRLLIKKISPEFFGRIQYVIPFARVGEDKQQDVVAAHIARMSEVFPLYTVSASPSAITVLSQTRYDREAGMRGFCRALEQRIARLIENKVRKKALMPASGIAVHIAYNDETKKFKLTVRQKDSL